MRRTIDVVMIFLVVLASWVGLSLVCAPLVGRLLAGRSPAPSDPLAPAQPAVPSAGDSAAHPEPNRSDAPLVAAATAPPVHSA